MPAGDLSAEDRIWIYSPGTTARWRKSEPNKVISSSACIHTGGAADSAVTRGDVVKHGDVRKFMWLESVNILLIDMAGISHFMWLDK